MSEKNSSIFGFNSDDVRSGAVEMPTESGEEAAEKIRRKPVGRWVYVLAVAVVSLIAAVMLISSFVDRVNDGLVMELQTGDIMPSNKADGLYTGSYSASDMGASVSVDVAGGYIISITAVRAQMGAVSHRRIRGPITVERIPAFAAASASSGEKPPSGPVMRAKLLASPFSSSTVLSPNVFSSS